MEGRRGFEEMTVSRFAHDLPLILRDHDEHAGHLKPQHSGQWTPRSERGCIPEHRPKVCDDAPPCAEKTCPPSRQPLTCWAHFEMSQLKYHADLNICDIAVTFDVSHCEVRRFQGERGEEHVGTRVSLLVFDQSDALPSPIVLLALPKYPQPEKTKPSSPVAIST